MYTLLPFKDAVLSEERKSMKWVVIFQVEIFWEGIFLGRSWVGGNFLGGDFPGGIFLEPFKTFFTKRVPVRYYYVTNIYIVYNNRVLCW